MVSSRFTTQHVYPHLVLANDISYITFSLRNGFNGSLNGPMGWDLTSRTQELAFLQSIGSEGSGDLPRYGAVGYTARVTHGECVKALKAYSDWDHMGPISYGKRIRKTLIY